MTLQPSPAKADHPKRKLAMRRDDQEFLPAALSLIETPPSPTRLKLSMTICALIVGALVWSWFGHFDVIAEAQGKFQPAGRVKVVQPIDSGRVLAIHAVNGAHVNAGDVLIELDPREADRIRRVGQWLQKNGEALYGTRRFDQFAQRVVGQHG